MHKLTVKEEEVMELMWKLGECAPKDIVAQYDEPRPHVNTVATAVQSLERKGFVGHRPHGRGYIYYPLLTQEDYGRSKLGGFVDRYFKNSYMKLVQTLVREEKVTEQELLGVPATRRNTIPFAFGSFITPLTISSVTPNLNLCSSSRPK